jgi:hypothetical protein
MSLSSAYTENITFTLIHARYIASKVATDLLRFHRLYGGIPSIATINDYDAEMVELLKHDVLYQVIYGFQRDGKWTEASVRYTALPGGNLATDDDPGKIRPGVGVEGAYFTSFLTYNSRWFSLPLADRAAIVAGCPVKRSTMGEPGLEAGYWSDDLNYFAGGRGLGRSSVRR